MATAGGERIIIIYKVLNFILFKILNDGTSKITSITFSYDSSILIIDGNDKILRIYNLNKLFELYK